MTELDTSLTHYQVLKTFLKANNSNLYTFFLSNEKEGFLTILNLTGTFRSGPYK